MPKPKNIQKLEESIHKKKVQLDKLEARIYPLQEKKQKLVSDIRALEDKQAHARYSEILGVIKGIDGIDKLTPEQIQATLAKAAQSAPPQVMSIEEGSQ
jgi:peptidoglycan hydrolase CwlO-like protein